jgi:hypothetical protein
MKWGSMAILYRTLKEEQASQVVHFSMIGMKGTSLDGGP